MDLSFHLISYCIFFSCLVAFHFRKEWLDVYNWEWEMSLSENRIIADSESICTIWGKELYLLLWALQHVDSCQLLLTFFISIRVANKATEDHLVAKWGKMHNRKRSVINLSLWDNEIRALEQRTTVSLLDVQWFGMFSIKCLRPTHLCNLENKVSYPQHNFRPSWKMKCTKSRTLPWIIMANLLCKGGTKLLVQKISTIRIKSKKSPHGAK